MSSRSRFSRRDFLKASLAAGVAPLFLPRRLWGASAPSNTVTVGMIGMGRQAWHSNLPGLLKVPGVRVVAVSDVDAWRQEEGRKKINVLQKETGAGCTAHTDYRELLARKDVDAVMISTPDHWHVPMAMDAVAAGKDVCCEKPLTLSIAEGRLLADAVKGSGRVFRTDSEFRSHWFNQRACEIVRNGKIGRLHTIRTGVVRDKDRWVEPKAEPVPEGLDYERWLGPAKDAPYQLDRVHVRNTFDQRPGWMRISDYADGVICNWGTHLNDIAQWGNNTDETGPVEVEATGAFPKPGNLWNTLISFEAHLKYANGVKLEFVMDRPYVRFEGDEGWVEADYNQSTLLASSEALRKWKPGPNDIKLPLRSEKRDFIDCVRTRSRTLADAEVGHRTNSLCHIALISIKLGGRKLKWDPVAERFDDPEANKYLTRPYVRPPWKLG